MRTSVSLNDDLASYVRDVASSAGENNAEAIRDTLRHGRRQETRIEKLEAEREELQTRIDELEAALDRVNAEKQELLAQREETDKLLRYVEQEREAEQQWRQAGLLTRTKWRVLGMPTGEQST